MNPIKQRKNSWEEHSPCLGLWVWDYLTDPSMPTTQILDWGNKGIKENNNFRNQNSRIKFNWKSVLRNQIKTSVSTLELTKERFLICKKRAKGLS